MLVKVTAIRHGQTDVNKFVALQGVSSLSLNSVGKQQALELANNLPMADLFLTSSMPRALETATIALQNKPNAMLCVDDGFKEVSFGIAETMSSVEAKAAFKSYFENVFNMQSTMNMKIKLPYGESHEEAIYRFKKTLNKYLLDYSGVSHVVIFTHGALIGALAKEGMGVGRINIKNGEQVEFNYNPQSREITNFVFDGEVYST